MSSKQKQMQDLWLDLSKDTECENITARRKGKTANLGLVNQFKLHNFIPNKWFDWNNSVDSQIMIIGQDWGPYSALEKFIDKYEDMRNLPNFNYDKFLYETFSSRTEKFIIKAIEETYPPGDKSALELSNFFIYTVAVMFTRKGIHFRGNHNFDPIKSAEHSFPFLERQISILQPKVIMPLGGLALSQVEKCFHLDLPGKNLTQKIENLGENVVRVGETVIIPNFHPAAYIDTKIQMRIWKRVWDFVDLRKSC